MIIMNKLQETTVFTGDRNDFRYETKVRKVMVHFKFDALCRCVSIESLLKSGSKKLPCIGQDVRSTESKYLP